MSMELSKEVRMEAVASLQRYFEKNLPEPIGELAAGLLLNYFLEEIGPAIYNKAIADAQVRMTQRAAALSGEMYKAEFGYWQRVDGKRKMR